MCTGRLRWLVHLSLLLSVAGCAPEADAPGGARSALTRAPATRLEVRTFTGETAWPADASPTFVVEAFDANGVRDVGYQGTVAFTYTGGATPSPVEYTFTLADQGDREFENLLVPTTKGPQTLTVTDTTDSSLTGSLTLQVAAAAPTEVITTGKPYAPVGLPSNYTFQTVDAFGNGLAADLTITFQGSAAPTVETFDLGGYSYSNGTLQGRTPESGLASITVTPSVTGLLEICPSVSATASSCLGVQVAAPGQAHHAAFAPVEGDVTAGSPVAVEVWIEDAADAPIDTAVDVNLAVNGSATFPVTGAQNTEPTLVGAQTLSVLDTTAETVEVTVVSATEAITGQPLPGPHGSATIRFVAGPVDRPAIQAPSSATAGEPFTVVAVLVDAHGNPVHQAASLCLQVEADSGATLTLQGGTGAAGTLECLPTADGRVVADVTTLRAGPLVVTATEALLAQDASATVAVGPGPLHDFNVEALGELGAGVTHACTELTFVIRAADVYGNPVDVEVVLEIDAGLITSTDLDDAEVGATSGTGRLGPDGTAEIRGRRDDKGELTLSTTPAGGAPVHTGSMFHTGLVSAIASQVTADHDRLYADGETTTVRVELRDGCGDPALQVVERTVRLSTNIGEVESPAELQPDGTYAATYTNRTCDGTVPAVITAVVEDEATLEDTASITLGCVDISPESEVELLPGEAQACASGGQWRTLRVALDDSEGRPLVVLPNVTIDEDPPYLVQGAVREGTDGGRAVRFVDIGSNRCLTDEDGRPVRQDVYVRSAGTYLDEVVQVEFPCPGVTAAGISIAADPPSAGAHADEWVQVEVTVTDACGHPVADRPVTLQVQDGAAAHLVDDVATTIDSWGSEGDGTAVFQLLGRSPGDVGVRATVTLPDGPVVADSPPDLVSFTAVDPSYAEVSIGTDTTNAPVGENVLLTVTVTPDAWSDDVILHLETENIDVVSTGLTEDADGGWPLGAIAAGEARVQTIEARLGPGSGPSKVTAFVSLGSDDTRLGDPATVTMEAERRSYYRPWGCASASGGGAGLGWLLVLAATLLGRGHRPRSRSRRGARRAQASRRARLQRGATWLGAAIVLLASSPAHASSPAEASSPVASSSPAEATPATPRPTLAFLGISPSAGVSPEQAEAVSEFAQTELGALGAYEVISTRDIQTLLGLEQQRQLVGCTDDAGCLAEIAGALGADRALSGTLARIGGSLLVNFSLLDVGNAKVIARVGRRVQGTDSIEPLLDVLRPILIELATADPAATAPSPLTGVPAAPTGPQGRLRLGLRADLDVLGAGGPAGLPGLSAGFDRGAFGAALHVLLNPLSTPVGFAGRPLGLRLEGRWSLLPGAFRPHVALGLTTFVPDLAVRAGAGLSYEAGPVTLGLDVAFERFVLTDDVAAFSENALLVGLEVAFRL